MRITYLGTVYDVQTGADAVNFLGVLATGIGLAADDLGAMARDVAITKARVDSQQFALQRITQAGSPGGYFGSNQSSQINQDAPLALLALRNQAAALGALPIAPPAPPPAPPVPVVSIHRSLTAALALAVVNPVVQGLALSAGGCDRTHTLTFTVNAPIAGGAGTIFLVTFGNPYTTVPTVQIGEDSLGSSFPVAATTLTNYGVVNRQTLFPGQTYSYKVVTIPTTENFD